MISKIENIVYELKFKTDLAKKLTRFNENDELNDVLLNQKLDEEWGIFQYTHR